MRGYDLDVFWIHEEEYLEKIKIFQKKNCCPKN